jgi:pimeloyl-ACP methyl ester carboxylesterase
MLLTLTLAAASFVPAHSASAPAPLLTPVAASRMTDGQRGKDDIGETVRLVTRDKVSLAATFFAPRAKRGTKAPGAVLLHDAGADRRTLVSMALYLQKRGFGVLTLDLRGHGQSATESFSWATMDQKARESAWAFASRDLQAASDYLQSRDEIHSANLSLVGVGAGSGLALRHAIDDENTRAVVLVGPANGGSYGFDLPGSVCDLEGLPCLIVAPKEGRREAEALRVTGHDANDGYEYVTVQVMKTSADELLEDRRLNSSLASWLKDEVMPDRH